MNEGVKIVAVIIAREGSSRLPGKAIGKVHGQPMIGHIVNRLKACSGISQVIIATSTNREDDIIESFAVQKGIQYFRGHPEDVLDRLYHSLVGIEFDAVIEVGGDCPFISPDLLDQGIQLYLNNKEVDFVSNALLPPYTFPDGYDFILLSRNALQKLHFKAKLQSERFQPFQYLIKNQEEFSSITFTSDINYKHWRWTLDYPEDLQFVKKVYEELFDKNPNFGFIEIKQLLTEMPEIIAINQMHAHNTMYNSAWYTGSYVSEAHLDIQTLLNQCLILDKKKMYEELSDCYQKISKIIEELNVRANIRKENG